jgi:hypothetical protein
MKERNEVFFQDGYFWHKPCAVLNWFPRQGRMIPDTIMSDAEEVRYECEVCGYVVIEKRKAVKKK